MSHVTAMTRWETFWRRVDQARTVPRLFLGFYAYQMWQTWDWATKLPDLTPAQSAFAIMVYGAAAPIINYYMSNGGGAATPTATTATSTVTTTPVKE